MEAVLTELQTQCFVALCKIPSPPPHCDVLQCAKWYWRTAPCLSTSRSEQLMHEKGPSVLETFGKTTLSSDSERASGTRRDIVVL